MAQGQINYTGGVVFQDFDTLPSSGAFTFSTKGPQALDQPPISAAGAAGWSLFANVGTPLAFSPDSGGSSTSGVYSYGVSGSSERALGFLANASRVCRAGLRLVNQTGQTLTQFTVSFVGEEWRSGDTTAADSISVDYRIQAASFDIDSGSAHTAIPTLAFSSPPNYSFEGGLNGNLSAHRTLRSATVTGISWPAGHTLMIRWFDSNSAGTDDALAIDDVAFYAPLPVLASPSILTSFPAAAATEVTPASRLSFVFNQPATTTGNWVQLLDETSAPVPVSVAGGPIRFEVTPAARLQAGKNYTLSVIGAQVTNASGTAMIADASIPFTTQVAHPTPQLISAVQGPSLSTPLPGQVVSITGIVTGDYQGPPPALGGFYIQSQPSDVDADPMTSEGLFVYDFSSEGSADVAVGDVVTLTGTALEFSNQTQISGLTQLTISGSAPLPASSDAALPVATSNALEPFEAMRVRFPQTLHVTSVGTNSSFSLNYPRNGELLLAADGPLVEPVEFLDPNDDPASGTTSDGISNVAAITAEAASFALRTIILDDATSTVYPDPTPFLNAQGTRRCGDTVTGLEGVLIFSGARYRLLPAASVPFVDANPRPLAPPAIPGRVNVAAMNVLNYFTTFGGTNDRGATNPTEFARQKAKVLAALTSLDADVLGLIEIQNTTTAVSDLLSALNANFPSDPYLQVPDPIVGASGDVIRCVWLYRPSKLRLYGPCFADTDPVWSTPDPLRYPLAQVFEEVSTGERFIGCLNHWKSKSTSSATGANLDQGDGQGAWNALRKQQAERLHVWLQGVMAAVGDRDVLIVGDLNSMGQEDPLDVLRTRGYEDQGDRFQPGDYSYRFGEARGRLDHAFASVTMASQVVAADHWHINADEPAFYDYNLENKSPAQQAMNVGTPFRSSDHDPVLIGISLSPQPTSYAMWAAASEWPVGASTSPGDDADLDGLQNAVEFVLNSRPGVPDIQLAPTASILPGGTFQFTYRLRILATGVTVHPQWSENLSQWFPLTNGMPTNVDSLTDLMPATVPIAGRTRLFGRLHIEIAP